jgi:transcriptional regulator
VYVPAHFNEDRIDALHSQMRATGLATLVSMTEDGLIASHAPMMLDPDPTPYGTLIGHLAKANPHARAADRGVQTLVIFQGLDGYITPSYYAAKQEHGKVVPTWNYAAVHAYGTLEMFDDPAKLLQVVTRLTNLHETPRTQPWAVSDARHRRHPGADRSPGGEGQNESESPSRGRCWSRGGAAVRSAGGSGGSGPRGHGETVVFGRGRR